MRWRRFVVVSALAAGGVFASGSIGSGTGLAAAPETLTPVDSVVPVAPIEPVQAVVPAVAEAVEQAPTFLRPEIIAHRGDHSQALENTPEAVAAALWGGADAVEFDVQATKDGIPVVLHDGDLRKHTVNCTGSASSKTYAQIRQCRNADGHVVPNLDEMLREVPAGKRAYIHLKTPAGRGVSARLMDAVNAYGMNVDGRAVFFHNVPKVLEELRSEGALSLGLIFFAENEARGWATDYDVLVPYRIELTPEKVAAAHARGQLVIPVENYPTTAAQARYLGVDGFMTDNLPHALDTLS
jgi:glycerophosphoryl diester phosphodiesterase